MTTHEPEVLAASQGLIEELMGAVLAVDSVLVTLMDLPEDVLPGENRAEAIRDFLARNAAVEVGAVGAEACRSATALIEAVVQSLADETGAMVQLAEVEPQRPSGGL